MEKGIFNKIAFYKDMKVYHLGKLHKVEMVFFNTLELGLSVWDSKLKTWAYKGCFPCTEIELTSHTVKCKKSNVKDAQG